MESTPTLFVVATPLGNLADMVPRGLEVLQSVDRIAAEDTRRSAPLLAHFGITTPMIAYHDHSGSKDTDRLLDILRSGGSIALISDAGTPLISDPGYRLVDAVLAEGFRVSPIPGASALIAALSVAGLPSDRFTFEGFMPAKEQARRKQLDALKAEPRTMIFYEAPHRLLDCVRDIARCFGGDRVVVLARELTKLYETVARLPADELAAWVAGDRNQQRGECVLLVAGYQAKEGDLSPEVVRCFDILRSELPMKQAASIAAKLTGVKKNRLYQYGLEQPLKK
ncbi:MAG: 16S rRNA (cytidine(1402)-2'-O)-methyltransferase [Spongiibacter marinus]|uniref:16S rRNA (cytidine(1402)-2'-O)-methyltransferase n=1 Tax=Spongiibacter TaxID=630749 RepID=UPI000C08E07A|nr:16S rRNA (cytidine(1402)-2'-O)-methyltransferase [Spongiibacter sp.]MAK44273.1 16S rRNA (cytidine(1402)-2'-O)-methyltransferase [Spongiibacter sp.]